MKIKLIFALFLITGFLVAQETPLSASEIKAFKELTKKQTAQIKSIKTNFIQLKHLDFLTDDIKSSGSMVFKAPQYLEWKYTQPFMYSIIFKDNKVLIDDQGNKSSVAIGDSKMFAKINKMIVGSVSGDMFDEKEFDITYFKTKKNYLVKLVTKTTMKKYIKEVNLFFPFDDATVSKVRLIESSNDYTEIQFVNKQIN